MDSSKWNKIKRYLKEQGEDCLFNYRTFVAKLLRIINDSDDPPTFANDLIKDMLDDYCSGMQWDYVGVQNDLYVGVKLCASSKLINTEVVCKLLAEINRQEVSFIPQSNFHENFWYFDDPYRYNCFQHNDSGDMDLEAIEYFLDETTKSKQLYWSWAESLTAVEGKKVRFADVRRLREGTTVYVAVLSHSIDLLLLLLRHGADLSSPKSPRGVYPAIARTLKLITVSSKWYTETDVHNDFYKYILYTIYGEFQSDSPYNAHFLTCLRYLLRAVPFIRVEPCQNSPQSAFLDEDCCVDILHPKLVQDNILPANRYKEPAELMQHCRCCIRKCLYDNWQLPHGINKLELPEILKEYLDLQFD